MPVIDIPVAPDFSATDLGNQIFSFLLGDKWWSLANAGADTSVAPFLAMLESLNWLLAILVSGFSLYNLLISSVGMASEGKVGGSSHTVWWPLRVLFGMSMTMPITAAQGLSAFQILILTTVGWSMTMANNIWENTLDDLAQSNFIVLTAEVPPSVKLEAQDMAHVIYNATTAQFYMQKYRSDLYNAEVSNGQTPTIQPWTFTNPFAVDAHSSTFYSSFSDSVRPGWIIKFAVPPGEGIKPEQMGYIKIPGEANDPTVMAKRNAIVAMYNSIAPVTYNQVYKLQSGGVYTDKGWLKQAVKAYNDQMIASLNNINQDYANNPLTQEANEFKEKAKRMGWFSAGAFPMLIAEIHAKGIESVYAAADIVPMDTQAMIAKVDDSYYHSFSITMAAAKSQYNQEASPLAPEKTIEDMKWDNFPMGMITYYLSGKGLLDYGLDSLKTQTPIIAISNLGHLIINIGIGLWTANGMIQAASGSVDGFMGSIVGKVAGLLGGGVLAKGITKFIAYVGIWTGIVCLLLFGVGLVFAYVLPAMPMIYWALAMLGFVLLVFEVLVAAPFWAAAHSWSTKDEGLAGEMGRRGYVQMLEILFRPPLYVLGFFIILEVMQAAAILVGALFEAYYLDYASHSTTMGWVANFSMAMILGGLNVYLFHLLCSEGYSKLPKKVIRWIGGEGQTLGAARHAEGMRNMIAGGVVSTTQWRDSSVPGSSSASGADAGPDLPGPTGGNQMPPVDGGGCAPPGSSGKK